jgi:hypothetical protein
MFNYDNYKLVDESLQAQLLWVDGVFLMARKTEKLKAELFSLYGFYVEVFFDEGDEPLFIHPFENMHRLQPYLKMIDINELLENNNNQ